jgi:hypothetical protein
MAWRLEMNPILGSKSSPIKNVQRFTYQHDSEAERPFRPKHPYSESMRFDQEKLLCQLALEKTHRSARQFQ